jgi:N-acetylglucosamine transport system substrate-binding protein
VVTTALEAIQALYNSGFILEGTEGLSHTESQTAWIEGEAAFLPCGAWLENEMKDLLAEIPEFTMRVNPVPSLTAEDDLPFETIQASAGEDFIVFSQANNVQGGKEWLRLLFSLEGARFFSEATKSLTVVTGAAEGLDLGSAFASVEEAIVNAGENTFVSRWGGWYADLDEQSQISFNELMTGVVTPEELVATMQAKVDEIRDNADIPKFTATAPGATAEATPAA